MSQEESTKEEKPEKPEKSKEDTIKITRTINVEFNRETGEIIEISDNELRLAILETREDGSIVRLVPPVPLVQELAITVQKLSVENALSKMDSDTAREGWKRLQGTLEETVREKRTTGYTTETIEKGFLQKNAKWIFITIIVIGFIFLYYYMSKSPPGFLDLGNGES